MPLTDERAYIISLCALVAESCDWFNELLVEVLMSTLPPMPIARASMLVNAIIIFVPNRIHYTSSLYPTL